MKKFKVEVVQRAYRTGFYEIEAPDEDAAYVLAQNIAFGNPMIKWAPFDIGQAGYPRAIDISVTEVKE